MKRFLKVLIPVLIVAVAIGVTVILVGSRPPPAQVVPQTAATVVEVVTAEPQDLRYRVRSQGVLRPAVSSSLVAEVAGKVEWVSDSFVAGGYFAAGEALLRIDPSDYRAQVKQAEAALAGREAQLAQEEARAAQARKDWNQLDSRRGEEPPALVLRVPQLAEAKANVQAAEADLDRARRNLQRTEIRMPYAGLVESKEADLGQYVAPGTRLGSAFSVDRGEVRLPLSSDDLAFVQLPKLGGSGEDGPVVTLTARLGGKELKRLAQLTRSEQVVDERARVIYAVASLVDPYALGDAEGTPAFPMGTFVTARIEGSDAGRVIALPRSTLRDSGEVLIANADDELEVRPVDVARADETFVYIRGGLRGGERVITTAFDIPVPGTALRVEADGPRPGGPHADGAGNRHPRGTPSRRATGR